MVGTGGEQAADAEGHRRDRPRDLPRLELVAWQRVRCVDFARRPRRDRRADGGRGLGRARTAPLLRRARALHRRRSAIDGAEGDAVYRHTRLRPGDARSSASTRISRSARTSSSGSACRRSPGPTLALKKKRMRALAEDADAPLPGQDADARPRASARSPAATSRRWRSPRR